MCAAVAASAATGIALRRRSCAAALRRRSCAGSVSEASSSACTHACMRTASGSPREASPAVLLELPLCVVERTDLTSLQPPRDAVKVERVITNTPSNGAFFRGRTALTRHPTHADTHACMHACMHAGRQAGRHACRQDACGCLEGRGDSHTATHACMHAQEHPAVTRMHSDEKHGIVLCAVCEASHSTGGPRACLRQREGFKKMRDGKPPGSLGSPGTRCTGP